MDLPLYQLRLSDDESDNTQVEYVSLVERPAIQKDFLVFNETVHFEIQDEEQRILTGPAMIPNMPIFQRNETYGEHYALFDAETVKEIAYRFFKKGFQSNINIGHRRDDLATDSVFFESWIVDRKIGKYPMGAFSEVPDGTWFLSAKINNDDTWTRIKSKELKGFSVEGFFQYVPEDHDDMTDDEFMAQLARILKR
ncbi:hypothetical protein KTO58_01245 [Chitinophaga pendula]|uniref:XkdF-like putative serine protease domain-containing protein n=1 Tax=Chitinophaga TaxID=79328 RepID=UPI000BAEC0C1|nr:MULTISPECIES: XkdF-like putative serine protease domain-containing protein [Chitinophaga]ASZ14512.1 hypothetical protein CK934_27975 [Chitinophaga sp. MD30]UCJ07831.1 hypothetical protein KTO58_01245 [Chitinophaga pendula]